MRFSQSGAFSDKTGHESSLFDIIGELLDVEQYLRVERQAEVTADVPGLGGAVNDGKLCLMYLQGLLETLFIVQSLNTDRRVHYALRYKLISCWSEVFERY